MRTRFSINILFSLLFMGCDSMANKEMSSNERLLSEAISQDNSVNIANAAAAGAAINAVAGSGKTPLMEAVDSLKPRAVAELLRLGANPNLKLPDGTSAMFLAVENYKSAPAILDLLLKNGGDPNLRGPDGDPLLSRFIADRNCEYIKLMKAAGANLDALTRAQDPIITDASIAKDWDVVWCLLELGAKFDYEQTRSPITRSLDQPVPSPDSPIYPYKVKVWEFFKSRGFKVKPLSK
jgi:uncharacterized protein